ncbi:MAG: 5-methyltetrahydropteroyltriglutamate--homocysteine S-methyltransferase [Bacteroidales bacterium]
MIKTHILGYPRIGARRELKKASEKYWSDKISLDELIAVGKQQRQSNWQVQKDAGIDLVPVNDFSFYDHILDMVLTTGAIPERYKPLKNLNQHDLYFAMARGYQKDKHDIIPMEMTKWFDTNYHYIVPEFNKKQTFEYFSDKIIEEFKEAKNFGVNPKPVMIGPVSFLLLGKEKEKNFNRLDLIDSLLPVYFEILNHLKENGARWIQFDEPFLALDLDDKQKRVYEKAYKEIQEKFPSINTMIATYFEGLYDNLSLAVSLPVEALHVDLVRDPAQLNKVLEEAPSELLISLGLVDGRNIWKNNFERSLEMIQQAIKAKGAEKIMLSSSCSLLHVPYDLDLEDNEENLPKQIKNWMAFAKQKLDEISTLSELASLERNQKALDKLNENKETIKDREQSRLIHKETVRKRMEAIDAEMASRQDAFSIRKNKQAANLNLPEFPTTTIGSFPQTKEVRNLRRQYKKNEISEETYERFLKEKIQEVIQKQKETGLDVLVHGEFERNDMVEYFGEKLEGFAFTKNGWVQSYGSRGVKPPIIYGDVERPNPMTVKWSSYAQSLTDQPVKGMLTGPVTILQWSFARDDQSRKETAYQIALSIRDEVKDLEAAGIKLIQIDEPAFREGLPLRKQDWKDYLNWATKAFRLASSVVQNDTQIHTHMCYSEFNDIIHNIAEMDADVITIETSRSQMELLEAFGAFKYPNEIGPGVYDIHSPRIPSSEEMEELLEKAEEVIPRDQLWVNPDCGLKTRSNEETWKALGNMVKAAQKLRKHQAEMAK